MNRSSSAIYRHRLQVPFCPCESDRDSKRRGYQYFEANACLRDSAFCILIPDRCVRAILLSAF